jgi:hypothetical protein
MNFKEHNDSERGRAMLAEKFILMLEARIRSGQYLDGSQRMHGHQRTLNLAELLTTKVVVKMMAWRNAPASTAS